jgi:hypothetical protein
VVGYVAFGEPTIPLDSLFLQALGGRCLRHVTGGELFLGQLHLLALLLTTSLYHTSYRILSGIAEQPALLTNL